jgi:hypothetical protein
MFPLTLDRLEPSPAPFNEPTGINPADKVKDISSPLHQYGQYLLTCLPKYIQQFSVYKDELTIYVPPSAIIETLTFLKDHSQCLFKQVMDITAVDYPTRKNRFEVGCYQRICGLADLARIGRLQPPVDRSSISNKSQDLHRRDQSGAQLYWSLQRR